MFVQQLLFMMVAGVIGYCIALFLHRKFVVANQLSRSSKAQSSPAVFATSSSSSLKMTAREDLHASSSLPAVSPSKSPSQIALVKRNGTREQIANLQKLQIGRNRGSSGSEGKEAEVSSSRAPPLSHPVFCPPVAALDAEQRAKVAELKRRVQEVLIPHYADNDVFPRFLGARQWDLDKAENMLRDAIAWRKNLDPIAKYEDLVSLSMAVQLSVVMKSKDKFGRTICYFAPRRHNSNKRDVDSALRVMIWFMDQLWLETKNTYYKKFVVLFNMKGFSMKNNDLSMVRAFLPILQNYYPEVVGRILLVEYPFIIWGLWKIIRPLMDVNTQNKVQFIKPEELEEHFDPESIPKEIGGLWEAPEPEVDLWDDDFDVSSWKKRSWEVIQEGGVYKVVK